MLFIFCLFSEPDSLLAKFFCLAFPPKHRQFAQKLSIHVHNSKTQPRFKCSAIQYRWPCFFLLRRLLAFPHQTPLFAPHKRTSNALVLALFFRALLHCIQHIVIHKLRDCLVQNRKENGRHRRVDVVLVRSFLCIHRHAAVCVFNLVQDKCCLVFQNRQWRFL